MYVSMTSVTSIKDKLGPTNKITKVSYGSHINLIPIVCYCKNNFKNFSFFYKYYII